MGYRVHLIAVSNKDPATIHKEYAVVPTEQYEEIAEAPVCGAKLPSGAYLLYVNDEIVPDDIVLRKLSKNASLVACYANETVMNSSACSWIDGHEQWSVFHDAQQGIKHLETTGEPPAELKTIQGRLLAEQGETKDTDYVFDIPIELFVASGGIRYDADIEGAEPDPWQVLARSRTKKWWWPFG